MKSESLQAYQQLILHWVQLTMNDKPLFVINHLFNKFLDKNQVTFQEIQESLTMYLTQEEIRQAVDDLRKFLVLQREEKKSIHHSSHSKYTKEIEIFSIDEKILQNIGTSVAKLQNVIKGYGNVGKCGSCNQEIRDITRAYECEECQMVHCITCKISYDELCQSQKCKFFNKPLKKYHANQNIERRENVLPRAEKQLHEISLLIQKCKDQQQFPFGITQTIEPTEEVKEDIKYKEKDEKLKQEEQGRLLFEKINDVRIQNALKQSRRELITRNLKIE